MGFLYNLVIFYRIMLYHSTVLLISKSKMRMLNHQITSCKLQWLVTIAETKVKIYTKSVFFASVFSNTIGRI